MSDVEIKGRINTLSVYGAPHSTVFDIEAQESYCPTPSGLCCKAPEYLHRQFNSGVLH